MINTFIRLSGKNSENRSSILSQVHTKLSQNYGRENGMHRNYVLHNDLIATFNINGERVGLVSHQNPSQEVEELLEQLVQLSCSVIVFTSVNPASTNETFNSMLRQHNFKTINLLPFWSQAMEFDYLAQVEVENIIELIEMLTEKKMIPTEKKNPGAFLRESARHASARSINF